MKMGPDPKRVAAVAACEKALDHARKMGALYDSIVRLVTQLTNTATGGDPRIPLELPEQPILWLENISKELDKHNEKLRGLVAEGLRPAISTELTEKLAISLKNERESEDH